MTEDTKKIIIFFAKKLRASKGYEYSYNSYRNYNRVHGSLSTVITKTIISTFDTKKIFLINHLSLCLNSEESPEVTLDRILKNLKIFVIVSFSSGINTIGCTCDDGYFECAECEGAEVLDCDICDGEGTMTDDETGEEIDCEECNGTGKNSCEFCNGHGYVGCSECDATGYISTDYHTDIEVDCFFSMLHGLNDKLTKDVLNHKNEDANNDSIDQLINLVENNRFISGPLKMNIESFELNYFDYEDAINFDIDEKYYRNKYVIATYDLFDPNLVITMSGRMFYVHTIPHITRILEDNFT